MTKTWLNCMELSGDWSKGLKTSTRSGFIRDWSLVIACAALLATVLVCGFLMFADGTLWHPIVAYDRMVFPTAKNAYAPGEAVYARVEAYKSRDIIGEIQWSLVNHKITYYTPRPLPLPSGVVDGWFEIEKLPKCEAGEYHFEGIVTYHVNPLRVVTYKVQTSPFTIMTKETQ
jgi:hypothetical protein